MINEDFRASVLLSYDATTSEVNELLVYNRNVFDHSSLKFDIKFPLPDELFAATWEHYACESSKKGVFEYLKTRVIQLRFPIKEGISQTETYRAATRKGISADMAEATGLILKHPEKLQLILHQTPAGRIPFLITRQREDFISLVQALTMRNEPGPVPASMGACMVAGYNNWDRIREYRKQWETKNHADSSEEKWQEEFQEIIPRKELYQDRFIILSDGPYSAVSATDIGLSEEEWKNASLTIRREHESAHYFTRRIFSSMRNNLIDELIADYMGIVAATGKFRADWFLRFLGLESFPDYRDGGRLQNYRGQPPLSDRAFKILQALVKSAAENLESFDTECSKELHDPGGQSLMLTALTHLTLEELASRKMDSLLQQALNGLREKHISGG